MCKNFYIFYLSKIKLSYKMCCICFFSIRFPFLQNDYIMTIKNLAKSFCIFPAYSRKDYLSDGRQIVFEISLVSFRAWFSKPHHLYFSRGLIMHRSLESTCEGYNWQTHFELLSSVFLIRVLIYISLIYKWI